MKPQKIGKSYFIQPGIDGKKVSVKLGNKLGIAILLPWIFARFLECLGELVRRNFEDKLGFCVRDGLSTRIDSLDCYVTGFKRSVAVED